MRRQRDGVCKRVQRAQRQRGAVRALRTPGSRAGGRRDRGRGGRPRLRRSAVVRHAAHGRLRHRDGSARDGADRARHDSRRRALPGSAATRVTRAVVVAGCVLAGLAAGAAWALLQADVYRADARLLVRPQSSRVVPAVKALAESSLIASNVSQTLHLASSPKISAKTGEGGVLTVSAKAGSRERARQIDAEVAVILTQKVAQRFGGAGVTATVLDPAHVAEQTSPTPGRDLLITGLAGLVVGCAVAGVLSRGLVRAAPGANPTVERRLQARIDQVAKRERALGRRAGQLAAREQDLERRRRELDEQAAGVRASAAVVPDAPAPEPVRIPEPAAPPVQGDGWTIEALEDLMRRRAAREPARRDELAA